MRNRYMIIIVFITVLLSSFPLFALVTATQNIVLDITENYTALASVRVFDGVSTTNPDVNFYKNQTGEYKVDTPGTEAYAGPIEFTDFRSKVGGYIQYTVRGMTGSYKITVHSATNSYNTNTLQVAVGDPAREGSGLLEQNYWTLGNALTGQGVDGDGVSGYIPIPYNSQNAVDTITDIDGENTWTTVGRNGCEITYSFAGNPGVNIVKVTYTILPQST